MPEGPEIKIISEELDSMFFEKLCLNVIINERSRYFDEQLFHSDYSFTDNIFEVDKELISVYSVGKKIIFNFGNLLFISSCLMNGRWVFEKPKNWSLCIRFEDANLYYHDFSKQSLFSIVDTNSENHKRIMKDVGEDYAEINFATFLEKISRNRIKNKQIQDFLMDQREFSGVGNYLKSEILYRSRIDPRKHLSEFSEDDFKKIFKQIKRTLRDSYRSGGFTLATYCSPSGKIGTFEVSVYGKISDPYGNRVEKINDKQNRITYWVPILQK